MGLLDLHIVVELHDFYAAPALGKNFDAAPVPALSDCIPVAMQIF
jgi:hypothetical protein